MRGDVIKYIVTVLLFAVFFAANSQNTSTDILFRSTLDRDTILIGEQVSYKLSATYRVDDGVRKSFSFPVAQDTLIAGIEIVGISAIDTLLPDSSDPYLFQQNCVYTITSFDSGLYVIPSQRLQIDSLNYISSEPLLFTVMTVPLDTTEQIMPIKPMIKVPFSFKAWFKAYGRWIILGVLVFLLLSMAVVYFIIKYKKKPKEQEEFILIVSPHEEAINALEVLKQKKYLSEGKTKVFHVEISTILRRYIERRYRVLALEQTTTEIMSSLRHKMIDKVQMEQVYQILFLADMVKFAKEAPLLKESELSFVLTEEFVHKTKMINTEEEAQR